MAVVELDISVELTIESGFLSPLRVEQCCYPPRGCTHKKQETEKMIKRVIAQIYIGKLKT
jgi:hypothetical protein